MEMLPKTGFRYILPQCLALVHALRRGRFGSGPSQSTLAPTDAVLTTRNANGAREGSVEVGREESDAAATRATWSPRGARQSSAARAHALAATYFRPRAVPSVHAIASAAALSAPPRASAKRSGVAARNRHAAVQDAIVAIVPPRVEP